MPGAGLIQRLQDRLKKSGTENAAHASHTESMAAAHQQWMERTNLLHQHNLEIMTLAPKSRLSSVSMGEYGPTATWRDPTPRATPAAAKKPRSPRQKPPQAQPPAGPSQGTLF